MTQLEKARAMQCFGKLVEYVEQDPDPKPQGNPQDGYNCKNCGTYEYCRQLADTLKDAVNCLT